MPLFVRLGLLRRSIWKGGCTLLVMSKCVTNISRKSNFARRPRSTSAIASFAPRRRPQPVLDCSRMPPWPCTLPAGAVLEKWSALTSIPGLLLLPDQTESSASAPRSVPVAFSRERTMSSARKSQRNISGVWARSIIITGGASLERG